jgi:hypothetical protein
MNALSPSTKKRFQLFVIDTGWQSEASKVVKENLPTMKAMLKNAEIFVLSEAQSREVLVTDPERVGTDPCIIFLDQAASGGQGATGYHGFRLSLGGIHSREKALAILKQFVNFAVTHQDCRDIERAVRSRLHKEGLTNSIEVLRNVI